MAPKNIKVDDGATFSPAVRRQLCVSESIVGLGRSGGAGRSRPQREPVIFVLPENGRDIDIDAVMDGVPAIHLVDAAGVCRAWACGQRHLDPPPAASAAAHLFDQDTGSCEFVDPDGKACLRDHRQPGAAVPEDHSFDPDEGVGGCTHVDGRGQRCMADHLRDNDPAFTVHISSDGLCRLVDGTLCSVHGPGELASDAIDPATQAGGIDPEISAAARLGADDDDRGDT